MKPFRWLAVLAATTLPAWATARQSMAQVAAENTEETAAQSVMIRGQAMTVWPNDDLRAKGFDIPEVAREENAFWTYLEAVNLYKDVPDDLQAAFDYAQTIAWPAVHTESAEKLAEFLLEADNQRALTLTRQASAMEQIEPLYFGNPQESIVSVLLPNLSAVRHLSKMLVADGRRLEEQGAHDQAVQNYIAAMRLGGHIGRGFTLIEGLVGVACWSIGDNAVGELVLRRDLRVEELREILKQLDELESLRPGAARGIQNERRFGMLIVDELTSRPFSFAANVGAIAGNGPPGETSQPDDGWGRFEERVGKLALPDRTIKVHLAAHYDRMAELAEKPAYEARWGELDEEATLRTIPRWDFVSQMLLPSLSRAGMIGERCRMQAMTTRLVVALRLYASDHEGEAPATLGELTDLVPDDDLIDPFSGKTFAYKHAGPAWRFYSFSENMVDDRGEEGANRFDMDYARRFPPAELEPFDPNSVDEN